MTNMTLGSLFDGIGGFPLAGHWLGIRPVWASEIEAAPISITKRHFPDMAHFTTHPVRVGRSVRRLTPMECERLQGFPDGWTELGIADMPILLKKLERDLAKGVLRTGSSKNELLQTISDSARYAAIGNSVALPCVLYMLEGIRINHKRRKHK